MPDSPVDHSLASEAAAATGASEGFNTTFEQIRAFLEQKFHIAVKWLTGLYGISGSATALPM